MDITRYTIELELHGRGGWVIYKGSSDMRFPSELSGIRGWIIAIPSKKNWKEFCESAGAFWAIDSRNEIIGQLATGAAKKLYWNGEFEIEGNYINVFPGASILVRFLERLFLNRSGKGN